MREGERRRLVILVTRQSGTQRRRKHLDKVRTLLFYFGVLVWLGGSDETLDYVQDLIAGRGRIYLGMRR